jgi:hypothetical protein
MDAGRRRVESELADRDPHAAGALVAQPEDPLVIGDHDQPDVLEGGVAQDLEHAAAMVGGDPQPPRAAEDVAELLAGSSDGRGIDDGKELLDVIDEHAVEEMLIAILERGEADVLLEGVLLADDVGVDPPDLLIHRAHGRGQQALEAEGGALLRRERGALRVERMREQPRAAIGDLEVGRTVAIALQAVALHGNASGRRPLSHPWSSCSQSGKAVKNIWPV